MLGVTMFIVLASLAVAVNPEQVVSAAVSHAALLPEYARPYARYVTTYDIPEEYQVDGVMVMNLVVNSLSTGSKLYFPSPIPVGDETLRLWYIDTLEMGGFGEESFLPTDGWEKMGEREAVLTPDIVGISLTSLASLVNEDRPIVRLGTLLVHGMDGPVYDVFVGHKGTREDVYKRLGLNEDSEVGRRAVGVARSLVANGKKRVIARRTGDFGEVWETFDFRDHLEKERDPGRTFDIAEMDVAGGEVIYRKPNGLFGYMLVDGNGERIQAGPADVVHHYAKPSEDPTIYNARSCLDCHGDGYKIPSSNYIVDIARENYKIKYERRASEDFFSNGLTYLKNDTLLYESIIHELVKPIGVFEDSTLTPQKSAVRMSQAISVIHRDYWARVTKERAMAELGIDTARFSALSTVSGENNFPLLSRGQTIDRTAWEGITKTLVLNK